MPTRTTGSTDPRYRTTRWRQLRLTILRRDGRRCSVPGCTVDMTQSRVTHVDHIREVNDGGDFWSPNNLHVLCRTHHMAKTLTNKAERNNDNGFNNDEPMSPNA